jgi:hypothetical protein
VAGASVGAWNKENVRKSQLDGERREEIDREKNAPMSRRKQE